MTSSSYHLFPSSSFLHSIHDENFHHLSQSMESINNIAGLADDEVRERERERKETRTSFLYER